MDWWEVAIGKKSLWQGNEAEAYPLKRADQLLQNSTTWYSRPPIQYLGAGGGECEYREEMRREGEQWWKERVKLVDSCGTESRRKRKLCMGRRKAECLSGTVRRWGDNRGQGEFIDVQGGDSKNAAGWWAAGRNLQFTLWGGIHS